MINERLLSYFLILFGQELYTLCVSFYVIHSMVCIFNLIEAQLNRRRRSYGNNKLAQVLHAKQLQKQFDIEGKQIKALSFCPGWTTTNILPEHIVGKFIAANAFPAKSAAVGLMMGLLDPAVHGGAFITSYTDFITHYVPGFREFLG
jgi:hypothetical protein